MFKDVESRLTGKLWQQTVYVCVCARRLGWQVICVQMFVAAIHASFKHCFEHPTTPSEVEKGSEKFMYI